MSVDHVAARQKNHIMPHHFCTLVATNHAIIQPSITNWSEQITSKSSKPLPTSHYQQNYNHLHCKAQLQRQHNYTTTTTTAQLKSTSHTSAQFAFQDCKAQLKQHNNTTKTTSAQLQSSEFLTHKCSVSPSKTARQVKSHDTVCLLTSRGRPRLQTEDVHLEQSVAYIMERRKGNIYLGAVDTCHWGGCC